MKAFQTYLIGLLLPLLLVTAGCSSSDGDSATQTNPAQSFPLTQLQSTAIGTVYTTTLTGSDSSGVNYTGSLSMANRMDEMLNGVLVTPKDLILSLTGGGNSITVTGTSYVDSTTGLLIQVVIQTTGLICTPTSPDTFPSTVKIGDFGIFSTMLCNDNTTQERSWRVEDAGNGNIKLISSGVTKDMSNTIISVVDVTYTINVNGDIVAFKTRSHLEATNYTLTYQSI